VLLTDPGGVTLSLSYGLAGAVLADVPPVRRPAMRPLAALYAISASLLVGGLVLQVFLAGLGVFDDPTFFLTHRDTGYALEGLAFFVIVFAAISRAGRAQVGQAALIFALFVLQSVFVALRESAPSVAALHPVNGFLILLLSISLARKAWTFARARRVEAPTPAPAPPVVAPGA
jgi:hypothetical protein